MIDRSESETGAAFLAVYEAEFDRLHRIAFMTTGSNASAEDIVHDAFVDALRRWEHIREPAAYLRRAVVNYSTSWVRRRVLERRHATVLTTRDLTSVDGDTLAVRDAFQRLSPRQRAAVTMRFIDGISENEIADALGCRPGTVKFPSVPLTSTVERSDRT